MLENVLRDRATIERLREGLFGPHLDSFIATLARSGYVRETVQKPLRLLNAFNQCFVSVPPIRRHRPSRAVAAGR